MCNHCDNAPCVAKGGGAVKKRDDGIVLIDPVKAKGRKDLVDACPYGHIWWNEELQLPQAWTFDAHLIDQGWKQTRGQQSCPTGAMRALCVDDDEMAKIAREQGLEVIKAGARHQPARLLQEFVALFEMLYRRLGVDRRRTASSIASRARACACSRTAPWSRETVTDNYGDFKFDRLDENSGDYVVEITAAGRGQEDRRAKLGASINLGEIRL